ncbi:MAG: hypothetical protein HFG31_05285 [Eubacterium sp.]|nr:hypothetical protein [Eubacterium sp.]
MLLEYLTKRKEILIYRLKENQDKLDHNLIAIVESKNKIEQIDSMIDEASEMFSVKAREDSGFKNQEINELEVHISAYLTENESIEKKIKELKEELSIIEQCIEKSTDVSRETLQVNVDSKINLVDKLKFCRDILDIDVMRARIELEELIRVLQ